MKYSITEIQRALDTITKSGGPTEIDISIDPKERLLFTYVDPMGGDQIVITLFNSDINYMATITKTTKLLTNKS